MLFETISLIIILLISMIFCVLITKKTIGGSFWILSPPVVMLGYFLSVKFIAVVLIESDIQRIRALAAHSFWFFGIVSGLLCLVILRAAKPVNMYRFKRLTCNKKIVYFFVILGCLSVFITFLFLGRVPLIIGISSLFDFGSDITMHEARRMNTLQHRAGDTFYFGQGYFRQIYAVVTPVFCAAFYLYCKSNNVNSFKKNISKALLVLFVFFAALNGQIWISAQMIVFFLLVAWYWKAKEAGNKFLLPIFKKGMAAYFGLLGFVFLYRYLQYLQGRHFENFFLDTFRRIYSYSVSFLFEYFPDTEPFRLGATWLNDLRGILPGSIQSFSYEVHYLVHGGAWGFTLSPGIVASSYVNFGYLGVLFTSMALTMVFTFFYIKMIDSQSSLKVALAIYLSYRFAFGMPGDFSGFIVSLITCFLILYAYIFLNSLSRLQFVSK